MPAVICDETLEELLDLTKGSRDVGAVHRRRRTHVEHASCQSNLMHNPDPRPVAQLVQAVKRFPRLRKNAFLLLRRVRIYRRIQGLRGDGPRKSSLDLRVVERTLTTSRKPAGYHHPLARARRR